jgi:predicted site-specific integrase-resolvase
MKKKAINTDEDLITVNEAAQLRKVHPEVIRSYIKRGRLASVKRYEKRLVYRAEVVNLVRHKPGPKKKPPDG